MSVVYPADPEPEPPKPGILQEASLHPVLAVLVIILGALALGFLVSKLRGSASASSTQSSGQPQVLYVPTSNTFETITDTGGTSGIIPPIGPAFPTHAFVGTVRASGQFPAWDALHSGPPIRSGPGGNDPIVGYAPWGSTLSLGTPVNGDSNQSGDPSSPGSTQWLPVLSGQGGYISRADLSGLNAGAPSNTVEGTGSGGLTPLGWHGFLTHNLAGHDALSNGEHTVFNRGHHPRFGP